MTGGVTRSRWSRVGAGVAGAVLLMAAVLVGAAGRYQPLVQDGDITAAGGNDIVLVEEFEGAGAHFVRYEHGASFTYAVPITNRGPVGVTVTRVVPPNTDERRLLQPGEAPSRPFALRPGETRELVVEARFDNCEYYTERALERVEAQTVRFRVAGIDRAARIPLQRPLLVRSPTIQGCPDRTLDRSEHRRTQP